MARSTSSVQTIHHTSHWETAMARICTSRTPHAPAVPERFCKETMHEIRRQHHSCRFSTTTLGFTVTLGGRTVTQEDAFHEKACIFTCLILPCVHVHVVRVRMLPGRRTNRFRYKHSSWGLGAVAGSFAACFYVVHGWRDLIPRRKHACSIAWVATH